MDEADELREQLMAKGIQNQTINVLVEKGFHDQIDLDDELVDSALSTARQSLGAAAVDKQFLIQLLQELIEIEKDIANRRRIAKQQGLDLQAINTLARMIRMNPGDGGESSINNFFAYAQACKVKLSGIEKIVQKFDREPESVLPKIVKLEDSNRQWKLLCRDITVGLVFSIVLIALIV